MKLYETLTDNEWVTLLENGESVSFFEWLINYEPLFINELPQICTEYFVGRSGSKTISPFYRRLIEQKDKGVDIEIHRTIADVLGNKFMKKWNRIYDSLTNISYNPLDEKVYTKNYNGSRDDVTTYDTNVVNDSNFARKETSTTNEGSQNETWGFNSVNSVPREKDTVDTTNTTESNSTDNTDHSTEVKTGSDSIHNSYSNSETMSGRDSSPTQLVSKEISFRDRVIFFDIVMADIDSIVTIPIYS